MSNSNAGEWNLLYKIAAFSALAIIAIFAVQVVLLVLSPPPSFYETTPAHMTAWFHLIQKNPLLGFLSLDALMLFDYLLYIPIYLAIYVALKETERSLVALGAVSAFIGTAMYFSGNPSFSMLSLGLNYSSAQNEAQRASFVAAGQAVLASIQTPFNVSYVLLGVAGLILSVAMLRTSVFSRSIAYVGLATYMLMLVPPTAGSIGMAFSLLSLVPLPIWLFLMARRFFQLGASHEADSETVH